MESSQPLVSQELGFFPPSGRNNNDQDDDSEENEHEPIQLLQSFTKQANEEAALTQENNDDTAIPSGVNCPIQISKQDTPGRDIIVPKNSNKERRLLVVIKNAPFHIFVGSSPHYSTNFNQLPLSCELVYDTEQEATVDFVKKMPLETRQTIFEEGKKVDIECRISVLTSQHEEIPFRVRITALDPTTGKPYIPSVLIKTDPIKVVSKPEQIRKKEVQTKQGKTKRKTFSKNDECNLIANDIDNKQDLHLKMIENISHYVGVEPVPKVRRINSDFPNFGDSFPSLVISNNNNHNDHHNQFERADENFEDAFVDFIECFNGIENQEKASLARRFIKSCSNNQSRDLTKVAELISTESAKIQLGTDEHGQMCTCRDCPHKKELAKVDSFYRDFLQATNIN